MLHFSYKHKILPNNIFIEILEITKNCNILIDFPIPQIYYVFAENRWNLRNVGLCRTGKIWIRASTANGYPFCDFMTLRCALRSKIFWEQIPNPDKFTEIFLENKKRNIQIKFRVTEEEKKLIEQKMALIPTQQMGAYRVIHFYALLFVGWRIFWLR